MSHEHLKSHFFGTNSEFMRMNRFQRRSLVGCALSLIAAAAPAAAEEQPQSNRAATLDGLIRCRSVSNDAMRLTCFDNAVAALDSAERAGEVVVLDREQVRDTNRRLFGFQIANPFADRNDQSAGSPIQSIETTLASAFSSAEGKWVFRLADESEWRQIDSAPVRFRNRAGEAVRVRRAALGSYMLTIDNSRAVRVRRQ